MKNHNYLEKLTAQQLQKWKEKKGAIYYYEWYDHLVNSVDLECAGAVLLAVLYYIRTLKTQPELMYDWNDTIWTVMIEKAIVHKDGQITFVFQNGTEIKVEA